MQDLVNGQQDILLPAAPALNAGSPVAPPLSAPLHEQNAAVPHDQPAESSSINNTDPPPPIADIFPAVVSHSTPPPLVPKQESKPTLAQREPREKKDSWKKKEAKETTSTPLPPPSQPTTLSPQRLRPPPYRQEDLHATPRLPTFTPAYTTTTPDGRTLELFRVSDQPFNKKKFRYTPCAAAPDLPQLMYRQISLEPQMARVNWQDMNPYVLIDKQGLCVTTEKGYRMARTNVCVREGDWYVEFKIERGGGDQGAHTRIGFARRETPLDVPVGFDGYSYGLRDVTGQKVHLSRPKPFMEPFGTGDVIGMHISLPPTVKTEDESQQQQDKRGVFRDRIPIRFRSQLYFEQPDYTASKEMDDLMNPILPPQSQNNPSIPVPRPSFLALKNSFIHVYKNGVLQGPAFQDLLSFAPPASQLGGKDLDDGMLGYYPAVSVFRHGIVRLNFGPEFYCWPKELEGSGVRGMWERYEEMVKEDREWDEIDEKEWEKDAATRMDTTVGEIVGPGAEIKELADDEWT